MYLIFDADKDTYISNRVINNQRMLKANVGAASSLDLYKLYGMTASGSTLNTELTRLLIHYDITTLREMYSTGRLDINDPSFKCLLILHDVYGGQPTPKNFEVVINPLSATFVEGQGRDIVTMGDFDVSNFLSGSADTPWFVSGAGLSGSATSNVDIIDTVIIGSQTKSLAFSQLFVDGTEDLSVDVTTAISATLIGAIPDNGFRIALKHELETNAKTYFVKRFGGRTAYNADKHPKLTVAFDDSIIDSTSNLRFDTSCSLFLRNYDNLGQPTNILSGVSQLTGSNCMSLKLIAQVSGGFVESAFSASQLVRHGTHTGVYKADVYLQSTPLFASMLLNSGSVKFTPVWGSLDGSLTFLSGSKIAVKGPNRTATVVDGKKLRCSLTNVDSEVVKGDVINARLNVFDDQAAIIKTKAPLFNPGIILESYYSIRDIETQIVRVPIDLENKSTKLSSDEKGLYFTIQTSNLIVGRTYSIDITLLLNNNKQYHRNMCVFKVIR